MEVLKWLKTGFLGGITVLNVMKKYMPPNQSYVILAPSWRTTTARKLKKMRSKHEIRAQKELEAEGWIVDYKLRPRFPSPHYNTDYFNLFDLMAYSPGIIRLISVKSQYLPGPHKQDLEEFKTGDGIVKECWVYRKLAQDKRKWVPKKYIFE